MTTENLGCQQGLRPRPTEGKTPPTSRNNHFKKVQQQIETLIQNQQLCSYVLWQGVKTLHKHMFNEGLKHGSVSFLRLEKLMLQWDPNQRRKVTSDHTFASTQHQDYRSHFNLRNNNTLMVPTRSHSQERISAQQRMDLCALHMCFGWGQGN